MRSSLDPVGHFARTFCLLNWYQQRIDLRIVGVKMKQGRGVSPVVLCT